MFFFCGCLVFGRFCVCNWLRWSLQGGWPGATVRSGGPRLRGFKLGVELRIAHGLTPNTCLLPRGYVSALRGIPGFFFFSIRNLITLSRLLLLIMCVPVTNRTRWKGTFSRAIISHSISMISLDELWRGTDEVKIGEIKIKRVNISWNNTGSNTMDKTRHAVRVGCNAEPFRR